MRPTAGLVAGLLSLGAVVQADVTWPASTDEIEEILYQLKGFRARLFSDTISPCTNEASGPGRQNAAEWLRVGFHDMSTANTFFGTGGLDASLQFELNNGENLGPGHNTTLQFLSNYISTRASMADLIAAGVVASVRSCGGPLIPLRLGRVDATSAGNTGVPQPGNSAGTFSQQFQRMGFSNAEMIQVTACGHTLGGVHQSEFPELVPAGSGVNGEISLDSTVGVFDNKIVTEYLDDTTTNPLIRQPSITQQKNSDFKVFSFDNNATMRAMADAAAFKSTCQTVLQKMIDTVPTGVTLTDAIAPYTLKPVDLQLTLNTGGTTMLFTGYIRLRTTTLDLNTVDHIVLTWKDRSGGSTCGSVGTCSTTAAFTGSATGFDDSFTFFPISTNIDVSTGISSFTVSLVLKDGSSQLFNNNGNGYPVSDAVILQKPQSCLLQGTGALTVTGLVRNDLASLPVNLNVSYLVPRNNTRNGNPVPAIITSTVPMTQGNCVGKYTFYSASFVVTGGMSYLARLDVTAGSYGDYFKLGSSLAGTCIPYSGSATCSNVTVPTSSSTSSTISSTRTSSSTATSATASQTLGVKPQVGGYNFVGCWTEGSGTRALAGAAFAYDSMTLETCMSNCTGYTYWGTEYGRECYCGNSLASSSSQAAAGDCNMVCGGNQYEYCGAGSRLELYSTTASAPPAPTGTLAVKPVVGKYYYQGCITEGTGARALASSATANDAMTLEMCATFCDGYKYFGAEYGRECYCGNSIDATSVIAAAADCSMTCAGNQYEYCGAGNRLELYGLTPTGSSSSSTLASSTRASSSTSTTSTSSSAPASSTLPASSTKSSTSTSASATPSNVLAHKPTVSPYSLVGCWTEGNGERALSAKSYASDTDMTLESCATFCSGYKYFGVEYSKECYCGNSLAASSTNASLADCSMTCVGNQYEYCGAGNRLELYSANITVPSGPMQPETVSQTWKFSSCYTEGTGTRALTSKAYADDTMTLESCAAFCAGYTYFGTEYGRECYCGSTLEGAPTQVPLSECSFPCAGNGTELCGAGGRLSLYTRLN